MLYPVTPTSPDFPAMERACLDYWAEAKIFERSVEERPADRAFVFYDGPPFANGLPHYGHLLTGFVKDAVARYWTQRGFRVERRFGWDCHGLPAEMAAEKELKLSGRRAIQAYGVGAFNDHCRDSVMRYTREWKQYVTRQARWVDFDRSYKTMDRSFMESVLWAFKQLHAKGLVYEAMRVMPYSWACETVLSHFETRMDNAYRSRQDKTVVVGFALENLPAGFPKDVAVQCLAWTTTPWTLPSNLALGVHPDLVYVCVRSGDRCAVVAESLMERLASLWKETPQIVTRCTGADLVGCRYRPLFPYFQDHAGAFRILGADFVTDSDGTGIVHLAPGFGEEDYEACLAAGIGVVCPVDDRGCFTEEVPEWSGMQVFEAIDPIIMALKSSGQWWQTSQITHDYPHCWRTDTPLIYRAVSSWYVKVTDIKDRMVELNQSIRWIPEHIRDGQFGRWLENARDWSISRNRFWGTPIPIWQSDDPRYPRLDVYGSVAEIEHDFGVTLTDLHKHALDALVRPNPDDPSGRSMMRRVPDVFDCWFESGSMPYGQSHYPFEGKEQFEAQGAADFIVEYVAQTRGWFYTLMVLSTALFDRVPFHHCICHGVILDEQGQKMSKRLGNYADPLEMFELHGADALRWLMLSSSVMRGHDLHLDKEGRMLRDTVRLTLRPFWNAYHFFTVYARADGIEARPVLTSDDPMDRYLLASFGATVVLVRGAMDRFDFPAATAPIEAFMDRLNNWWIRRNRHRFWRSEKDASKQAAFDVLWTVLDGLARLAAPLLPLLSEVIYLGLRGMTVETAGGVSVHLTSLPEASGWPVDEALVASMERVRRVCNAALAVRHRTNRRVRQPLGVLRLLGVAVPESMVGLIQDEVNVKSVEVVDRVQDNAERELKLQFKQLGKRLPQEVPRLLAAVKAGSWLVDGESVWVDSVRLEPQEYQLQWKAKDAVSAEGLEPVDDGLIWLDTSLTESLIQEGWVRDVVRAVQQGRKDAGLEMTDRIWLRLETEDARLLQAVALHASWMEDQTLSTLVTELREGGFRTEECFDEADPPIHWAIVLGRQSTGT